MKSNMVHSWNYFFSILVTCTDVQIHRVICVVLLWLSSRVICVSGVCKPMAAFSVFKVVYGVTNDLDDQLASRTSVILLQWAKRDMAGLT